MSGQHDTRSTCLVLERPVPVPEGPGAAEDAHLAAVGADDLGARVREVLDVSPGQLRPVRGGALTPDPVVAGFVQEEVVVPGNDNLVGVGLGLDPVEGRLEFSERAGLGQVSCVDEDVATWESRLAVMCVGDTDD